MKTDLGKVIHVEFARFPRLITAGAGALLVLGIVGTSSLVAGSSTQRISSLAVDSVNATTLTTQAGPSGNEASAAGVAAALEVPTCEKGSLPILDTGVRSPTVDGKGAASPEAAIRLLRPGVAEFSARPWFGESGPLWIAAGSETFFASRAPEGGWVVATAEFRGCRAIPASGTPTR